MSAIAQPRRAEHLGSLLRPKEITELAYVPNVDEARRQAEDKAIAAILDEQTKLGFRAVTDGEYRRTMFWGTFFNGLEGFSEVPFDSNRLRTYMPSNQAIMDLKIKPPATICTGKIKHTGRSNHLDEFNYTKNHIGPDRVCDIKLTMPSPNWYHIQYRQGHAYTLDAYQSDVEYFSDLAAAYRKELLMLYDAGLRRVQIDDPFLSYFCSPTVREGWAADPDNIMSPDEMFQTYVRWYNDCFRDLPADLFLGMHICRGNFTESRYWAEGSYEAIARTLFQDSVIGTFYLEYDSPRAGSFEPLKHLQRNKRLVLGVVTTKSKELEDPVVLKERVHTAAKHIAEGNGISEKEALQQLSVSPQCGFASHNFEDRLTREDMLAKLKLVRDLANTIWPGEP